MFHIAGCEAYYFTTVGYGIFNVRTNVDARRTHEGGSGTNKSAHGLTRRDRKTFLLLTLSLQGLRIRISTLFIFNFILFFIHFIIPLVKSGPPYPGKATAAARAALLRPTSVCWVFRVSVIQRTLTWNTGYLTCAGT